MSENKWSKWRKILGIVCSVLAVVCIIICLVGQFMPNERVGKIVMKVGIALVIVVVVFASISAMIFQLKDGVSVIKSVHQKYKQEGFYTKKEDTEDYIDPETGALKDKPTKRSLQVEIARNTPKPLKWLNLILLIIFLISPLGITIFRKNNSSLGLILFGCGFFAMILLVIINIIYQNRMKPKLMNSDYAKTDALADVLSEHNSLYQREVPVQLVKASVYDAEVILDMQKIAFDELLEKYKDYDTSPANETIDKVKSRFNDPNTYHYFIQAEDMTVGVIRVVDTRTEEKKRLDLIFIMPEYRCKGYAYWAIKAIEEIHGSKGWQLNTILQESQLLDFYDSLGYKMLRKSQRLKYQMTLVFFEK